jgi:hypothetical protein
VSKEDAFRRLTLSSRLLLPEGLEQFRPRLLRYRADLPSVYFLTSKGEITYIGKAKNPFRRIPCHRRNIPFSRAFILPVNQGRLEDYEATLIAYFQPRFNSMYRYGYVDRELLAGLRGAT